MKLWDKGVPLDAGIEAFTVGNDAQLDHRLLVYDCRASIAHARMLHGAGILSDDELGNLVCALAEISALAAGGKFTIEQSDEDGHTAIENFLVRRLGDTGKKIHTARSRNDQVLTALRLYEKDALAVTRGAALTLQAELSHFIARCGNIGMPGYTHMRKAMPTSVGDWLSCYVDALHDDLMMLAGVEQLIDQSPLGTAAGFGVPVIALDRKMGADLMGFSRVQHNPIYAQMSRGKFEIALLGSLVQFMLDLNRLASDLILFQTEEFGFVTLAGNVVTGSSIMPQKKNPDVLELIRAKYHVVLGEETKLRGLTAGLIFGYHRDLQLTKEPIFVAFDCVTQSLAAMTVVLAGLQMNQQKCTSALTPEIFATQRAYELVLTGTPFRDAYRIVAQSL